MSKRDKLICKHLIKTNLQSHQNPYILEETGLIVQCDNCKLYRYETRNKKTGSITTSKWFESSKIPQ